MTRISPGVTLSPRDYDAVLFDLNGVLTKGKGAGGGAETAFDIGEPLVPFDIDADYRRSAYFVPTATGSDSENPASRLSTSPPVLITLGRTCNDLAQFAQP